MTAVQINGARDQYTARLNQYNTFVAVKRTIKAQIIAAVPDFAIRALYNEDFGYAAVTPEQLITHLITQYGTIDEDDLEKNQELCKTIWDPSSTIEAAFAKLAQYRHFATVGQDAISDAQAIRFATDSFEKSGLFTEALKDWRKKPAVQRTLDNLKTHMIAADKERLREQTALKTGMANKATEPKEDKNNKNTKESDVPEYYCWTHGLGRNPGHTSATCTRPAEGHQKLATLANMMGGNNFISRKKGEKGVYKRPPRTTRGNNTTSTTNEGSETRE
jgi:hypothetical protein